MGCVAMTGIPASDDKLLYGGASRNENAYDGSSLSIFRANGLTWAKPEHSRVEVDKAGSYVAHLLSSRHQARLDDPFKYPGGIDKALEIVNNWRSSHNFPLNTFQMGLRTHATSVDPEATIAQRIKRLASITYKLRRFSSMTLTQMQDIGGCRAIVADVASVREIRASYARSSMKHKLVREKDYMTHPKTSGYRGIHLIYRYKSDRMDTYNGHQIEIQVRSRPQHVWATAVETVGTLVRQSLKSSSGEQEWLRFFSLMSSYIALQEKAPPVPGTPDSEKPLLDELRTRSVNLQVESKLKAYRSAIQQSSHSTDNARWYLLEFYPQKDSIVTGFKTRDLGKAMKQYLETEKRLGESGPGAEVVLVSVDRLSALETAYPSYFADTDEFLQLLNKALS